MMMMPCTIGANWIMVVIPIAVIPIQMMRYAVIWVPPTWPIIPVIRRVPAYPAWPPKPVIYQWTIDIYRLYDIVRAIHILITYDLDCNLLLIIFIHIN
jgi:hypothetical protein